MAKVSWQSAYNSIASEVQGIVVDHRRGLSNCGAQLYFDVIPFRFGTAAPEPISKRSVEFYRCAVQALFPEELVTLGEEDCYSLSISLSDLEINDSITYQKFLLRIKTWSHTPCVLVVDIIPPLETLIPGRTELHIATALTFFSKENTGAKFVVFVDTLPPEKEAFRSILEPLILEGRLLLIDNMGKMAGKPIPGGDLPADFQAIRHQASQDPLKLLDLKMVRRRGHFRRTFDDGSKFCTRFFYDGSECIREISTLIKEFICNRQSKGKNPILLFHCTISRWLESAVKNVGTELDIDVLDILHVFEKPELLTDINQSDTVLVLPLIDTKRTLIHLVEDWSQRVGSVFPDVLSIITTKSTDPERQIRNFVVAGQQREIRYFHEVQRGLEIPTVCQQCEIGISPSSIEREDYEMLTSYEFWSMADEVGWKPEDNVPPNRKIKPLPCIPDFPKMFKENGAWLAQKVSRRLLSIEDRSFPARPFVLLCPNEDGARVLSTYLQALHEGYSVIRVPEEDLKEFRDSKNFDHLLNALETRRPSWYVQLTEASHTAAMVIVEEFCVSGGTRSAFLRLLTAIGRTAWAHVAIVDFCPSVSKESKAKSVSLYKFDACGTKP